jgi:hypothetical protein
MPKTNATVKKTIRSMLSTCVIACARPFVVVGCFFIRFKPGFLNLDKVVRHCANLTRAKRNDVMSFVLFWIAGRLIITVPKTIFRQFAALCCTAKG